jgi:hypothetical protein
MSKIDTPEIDGISIFTWETQFEKSSREQIRASTQNELKELKEHYRKTLREEARKQKQGEIHSPYLQEMLHRLLSETERGIDGKIEILKMQILKHTPITQGVLPVWFSWSKMEVLQNGKVKIGLLKEGNNKNQIVGFTLTGDEYLGKVKGKSLIINEREVVLKWSAEWYPLLDCKQIKKREVPRIAEDQTWEKTSKDTERSELEEAKAIIAALRRDILTDTSPLTKLLFSWTNKAELDLSRTSFAAWKNQKDIDYAQIMEDEGRIYSIWWKVADGKRPLIIVDRQNLVVLFAGSIRKDDTIVVNPWYQWPKDRDMKAYAFQPKIPIVWKI